MLLIDVFTLYLTKNTQFFKVAVYRAARHLSNIRLTCICAFADAHSGSKVGAKVALKGSCSSSDRPSNFRDKTNVSVEAVLDTLFYLYLLLDTYTLHYFASYYYLFIHEKISSLRITRLKHQNTTFIFLSK